jgi:hypothetical protein
VVPEEAVVAVGVPEEAVMVVGAAEEAVAATALLPAVAVGVLALRTRFARRWTTHSTAQGSAAGRAG